MGAGMRCRVRMWNEKDQRGARWIPAELSDLLYSGRRCQFQKFEDYSVDGQGGADKGVGVVEGMEITSDVQVITGS